MINNIYSFKKTKSFKAKLNFLIIFLFVLGIGVFGFKNNAEAATYYMNADGSEDCSSLQECFGIMSGGDELIIRDGTYTGSGNYISSANFPPLGTPSNWTVIKAEHDGKIFFGDPDSPDNTFYVENKGDSYIQFEGLVWLGGCHVGAVNYLKFLRCGSGTNLVVDGDIPFSNNVSSYLLYEDCYAWGGGRYKFSAYRSEYIVYRRCVMRLGAIDTTHDNKTEPIAGIAIYWSSNCEVQNCIILDSQTSDYWVYESLPGAFTTPNIGGADNYFRGCIGLKLDMALHGQHNAYTNTNRINCIGWDITRGAIVGGVTHFYHNTIGNIYSTQTNVAGINAYDASADAVDSIFVNISTDLGALYNVTSDYNCFYNNSSNYSGGSSAGSHDLINVNPLTTSLLYLPRIEPSSILSGKASDGGDIGATVMKRIGVSGTLWGEPGYNTTTTEDLWPWPNEDIIKENFRTYSNPNIDSKRGFCADGNGLYGGPITLTSYIWEYLGNPCPTDICNYSQSDTTPPTLSNDSPAGTLPSGTTQTTLSITTNENSTCKYSTTPGTDYSSIPNTFTTTGGTTHSTTVTGLTDGNTYNYYIRCQDESGNSNTTDTTITFSISPTSSRADVDNNSQINTTDAMLTLRNSLGLSMTNTNWQSSSTTGDVNCDGTTTSTDAMLILRYSLGLSMEGTGWCEE